MYQCINVLIRQAFGLGRVKQRTSTHQPVNLSTHRYESILNPSSHQLIDSTHQPINPSTHRLIDQPSTLIPLPSSLYPQPSTLIVECINVYRTSLIIYDFLEVPCGLGRLPWVPGASPGGSLGGGPGPMSAGQKSVSPLGFRIVFCIDFVSIFDRLGVDLGSVLGVIFGHFGALVGQSWSQSRLRTVLTSKK